MFKYINKRKEVMTFRLKIDRASYVLYIKENDKKNIISIS